MAEIRRLRSGDDRSGFRSGDPDLDRFFARFTGQNQFRHHVGVTWVAVEGDAILAFATVSPGQLEVEALPERIRKTLPRYPLPVLRLARLAVDGPAQGRGLGSLLLVTVFELAREMAETVGCLGVVVDAKPKAVGYYERLDFRPMDALRGGLEDRPEPIPMFLPLAAIPRSVASR